jgi:ribosomal protein S18 acetylase RimI-like enzyme
MGSMGTPEVYGAVSQPLHSESDAPLGGGGRGRLRPMDPQARLATPADLDAIADALADAFHDDPVMTWLFGATAPRPMQYSRPYFRRESARHLRQNHVYTMDGAPGAALWDPPGHWRVPPADIAKMAPIMLRGIGPRTIKALRGLNRIEKAHASHPDHYYLAVLGTRVDQQGHGVASRLLAPVLATCDQEGIGAYLESSKESNLAYYRRHGFEVLGEVHFPKGPCVWPMWRDPRAPE